MTLIGVVPSGAEGRKITLNQDYVEAVLRGGGTPVLFPLTSDPDRIAALLDQVDGLLLTGGPDVEPSRYGEKKKDWCGECAPDRDSMEFPLCLEALRRRIPVFAICRGMQVLSCALGGDLYQDLSEELGTELLHPRHDIPADPVHEVTVSTGSLLASIVGAGPLPVNSRHHQGIRIPGEKLRVSAAAPDGLAEGIELPGLPFVLGVQWHPETLSERYAQHQKLFDAFIRASANHGSKTSVPL